MGFHSRLIKLRVSLCTAPSFKSVQEQMTLPLHYCGNSSLTNFVHASFQVPMHSLQKNVSQICRDSSATLDHGTYKLAFGQCTYYFALMIV